MNVKQTLLAFLLFSLLYGNVYAERIAYEEMPAIQKVAEDLAVGIDRQVILERLDLAIEKDAQQSPFEMMLWGKSFRSLTHHGQERAKRLRDDLADSIKLAKARKNSPWNIYRLPYQNLMETKCPISYIKHSYKWDDLAKFIRENPNDPMSIILKMNQSDAMAALYPMWTDRSPVRSYQDGHFRIMTFTERYVAFKLPRVCDMAVEAMIFHADKQFKVGNLHIKEFHKWTFEEQYQLMGQIKKWRKSHHEEHLVNTVKKQLSETIIKNLDKVMLKQHTDIDDFELAWHAYRLLKLTGKKTEADRKYGTELLLSMVRSKSDRAAVCAANLLASLNNNSAIEIIHDRIKKKVDSKEIANINNMVEYLAIYGGRREWELLHSLTDLDMKQNDSKSSYIKVSETIKDSSQIMSLQLTIPSLAQMLTQKRIIKSRTINKIEQLYTYADIAVERLQILTKEDFGYQINGTKKERTAAIAKAQKWWIATGRTKYSFDNIEKQLKQIAKTRTQPKLSGSAN